MPIAIGIRINVNHTKSHPANIILRLRKKKNVRISIIIDAWRGLNQSPFGIIIIKKSIQFMTPHAQIMR